MTKYAGGYNVVNTTYLEYYIKKEETNMKRRSTKSALLMSAISLLLCVSMLIGSTFAWFTDSVTSANNIIKSGTLDVELDYATKIENGAEEVAEVELTVSVMPDEYGNGVYEALADELAEEKKTAWMTAFEPAMVQVSKA